MWSPQATTSRPATAPSQLPQYPQEPPITKAAPPTVAAWDASEGDNGDFAGFGHDPSHTISPNQRHSRKRPVNRANTSYENTSYEPYM